MGQVLRPNPFSLSQKKTAKAYISSFGGPQLLDKQKYLFKPTYLNVALKGRIFVTPLALKVKEPSCTLTGIE